MSPVENAECNCESHGCRAAAIGYTLVSQSTRAKHRHNDQLLQTQHLLDENTLNLQRLSVSHVIPNQRSSDEQNRSSASRSSNATIHTPSSVDKRSAVDEALTLIDHELRFRINDCLLLTKNIDELDGHTSDSAGDKIKLQDHMSWMTSMATNLKQYSCFGDEDILKYRNGMIEVLESRLKNLQDWQIRRFTESKHRETHEQEDLPGINRGVRVDSDPYFNEPLLHCNPIIFIVMFLVVVLNVIQGLPKRSSNFLLKMLSVLLEASLNIYDTTGNLKDQTNMLFMRIPKDIRTVRSRFNLKSETVVFAACPACSSLHKPVFVEGQSFPDYPSICDATAFDGPACGANLLKRQVIGGESVEVPARPYSYHSIQDFIAKLVSRPEIEVLLERHPSPESPHILTDIFDGSALREFKGPDGNLFFTDDTHDTELRLAWALSVDWFNPYHNKIAGKTVSVGVISLVCLNLPLHMRYDPSNMILVGIIPGPREPSLEQVNHFLNPLIDEFCISWDIGFWVRRTCKYPNGRRVRSVLVPLVADLPASRKVSGTAGHASLNLCPLCPLKKGDIGKTDVESWQGITREQHLESANKWLNAKNQTDRQKLVKENGVRWSALFRLPYWKPQYIVVDAMHNLLLGLVQHHFRVILGIDFEKAPQKHTSIAETAPSMPSKPIPKKTVYKILCMLKDNPTKTKLGHYGIDTLYNFHRIQNIPLPQARHDGSLTKRDLVSSLMFCRLVPNATAVSHHTVRSDSRTSPHGGSNEIPGEAKQPVIITPKQESSRLWSRNYIGQKELAEIQSAIKSTVRPSWQQAPPAFGSNRQGKLKADQWRTLVEFDLPIALVLLWSEEEQRDPLIVEHYSLLLDITMSLALAIFWGTSRRTSINHKEKYTYYMKKYIQGIQSLHPRPKLVPNHHSALHIGEQLLNFGPVYGWWCFPFERLIGTLQRAKTNFKLGEMEMTMQNSFYTTAHLRQVLQRLKTDYSHPRIISKCVSALEYFYPTNSSESYTMDSIHLNAVGLDDNDINSQKSPTVIELEDDIYAEIRHLIPRGRLSRQVRSHKSYTVNGFQYNDHTAKRDYTIFYTCSVTSSRVPGIIRQIFSMRNGETLFAIHPYLPFRHTTVVDPFTKWPEYGASLWSEKYDEKVVIIRPDKCDICHAAYRPWKYGAYVFRAIDRVRGSVFK